MQITKEIWPLSSEIHNSRYCECREHLMAQCVEELMLFCRRKGKPQFPDSQSWKNNHRYYLLRLISLTLMKFTYNPRAFLIIFPTAWLTLLFSCFQVSIGRRNAFIVNEKRTKITPFGIMIIDKIVTLLKMAFTFTTA